MAEEYALGSSWIALSTLIAFASVLVAIIAIMVSRFFQNSKLEQAAKSEFMFAASTVVLVLFVVTILPMLEDMATNYITSTIYIGNFDALPDEQKTMAGITEFYLSNAYSCATTILNALYAVDIVVQTVLSIAMEVVMSEIASGFFMGFFSERITNMAQMLTFYMIIYFVMKHILVFLNVFGMFFFTFGVLLRAFPLTRGSGAFIMALSIGLYFIFPLSYIIMGATLAEEAQFCDITELPDVPTTTGGALDFRKAIFENSLKFQADQGLIEGLITEFNRFTIHFANLMCFLPFLALVVTLSFVLSTSSMAGATIPEVGRGLVKLI